MKKLFLMLLLLMYSSVARAHFVEQFFINIQNDERNVLVSFDVGYAIVETRDDPSEKQPTRKWLVDRSDVEHQKYREEAESYLRSGIRFVADGVNVNYTVKFPDFNSQPYNFPRLLNRGAYYNVELIPERWDSGVSLALASEGIPKLVMTLPRVEGEDVHFATIDNGETMSLGLKESPLFEKSSEGGVELVSKQSSSFWQLLKLGFEHVIPDGLDHILFIVGMCLMASTLKNLMWQSVVFTCSHSLSMGLVVADWLPIYELPVAAWIEPLIALSISFIAVESMWKRDTNLWRYSAIGVFGFIHGLGFAGSLGSALQSLIEDGWLLPLLISNLGIEVAQMILIFCVVSILFLGKEKMNKKGNYVLRNSLSIAIAITGLVWFIQRII